VQPAPHCAHAIWIIIAGVSGVPQAGQRTRPTSFQPLLDLTVEIDAVFQQRCPAETLSLFTARASLSICSTSSP
jgi:hypothetical protein